MKELEVAIQLRESGNLEEARSLLLKLLEQQPLNPSVWYQCAWLHDVLELEREAVPYYKKSLELGLQGEERQGALLGLGSTFRTLGMYEEAKLIFEKAIKEYPERREYQIFYAMVLYNMNEFSEAMSILLKQLAETSNDEGIQDYRKAILFYSDKLDSKVE
ncbi:tetratricopeptide repeat protein [Cohnella terricola]|uniref:Tetratricopeptide repeat protein n=1 Tax=Cohnella terricola TaxID=1289167 RepID=A0A559J8T3_9BACL|nr:tetratricopeptide repeat protein [Cohnella terricola]TVX96298.1 tetratricopeptide repeat protein [Cohnella terricola]